MLDEVLVDSAIAYGELTIDGGGAAIVRVLTYLRDEPRLLFKELVDLCGVDYPAARAAVRRGLPPAVAAP